MIDTGIERVDINGLRAGDDWSIDIPLIGVLWLTGDVARMHIRTKLADASPFIRLNSMATAGQGLILLTAEGITLQVDDALTSTLSIGTSYVYDIEIDRDGQKQTLFGGKMFIEGKVTRGV